MHQAGCTYFAGSQGDSWPLYDYVRRLPNGSSVEVAPVRDAATGLCYYPDTECASGDCCTWSPWVDAGMSVSLNSVTYAQLAIFVILLCGVLRWIEHLRRFGESADELACDIPRITGGRRPPSGVPQRLNTFGAIAGIGVTVLVGVVMSKQTQLALTVQSRNAMLATEAFLEPVKDIFQFLEDATTVKITYAIGSGNYGPVRTIAFMGVLGGLATGAVAAVLMTGMTYWSAAMEVLVAPGSSMDLDLYPGCSLMQAPADIAMTARSLWLLKVWSWPFQFSSMVLSGLLLGAHELFICGCVQVLSSLTYYFLWECGPDEKSLELLGWASLGSQVVFTAGCIIVLLLDVPLRVKFGLLLNQSSTATSLDSAVQKRALRDGLLAMSFELTLQATGTIGVYVAGYQGLHVLYQISAAGAAKLQYTAFSDPLAMIVKLAGGAMIGYRMFREFRTLICSMAIAGIPLGISSAWAILRYRTEVAGYYGSSSCAFATDVACLGIYDGLFWGRAGKSTIFETFNVLAVDASVFCLFTIARAGLYASQDFGFMAKSAFLVFLLVFVPAIFVARVVFDSATAVYTACALPTWVLTVIFFLRLSRNSRLMLRGEDGPWMHSLDREVRAPGELESAMLPSMHS